MSATRRRRPRVRAWISAGTRRGAAAVRMSLRSDVIYRVARPDAGSTDHLELATGAQRAARADAGRQDLADAADGRPRPAERGPRPGRRRGRHRESRAQAQRRHGLPAVHQLPALHASTTTSPRRCAWQGMAADRDRRQVRETAAGAAHRPPARPPAGRALRRPAAAVRDRPGAGQGRATCCCSTSRWSISTTSCARSCGPSCRALRRPRRVVVYATTEPLEALIMGGDVIVMDEGRILQPGPTSRSITARPRSGGARLQRPADEHYRRRGRGAAAPARRRRRPSR